MPTTLNINTNFVGTVAGGYIAEMIKEANTISENLVTIVPNITSPQFIRKINTTGSFVDYSCGWNPTGIIDLSEKELAPKKVMEQFEVCKEDFRQLWTAAEMGFSAHNDSLPATEQAAILADIGRKVARKVDVDIWEGVLGAGRWNGLIPLLVADPDTIDVATPVAITATNVVAEAGRFIDAIPDAVLSSPGLVMAASTNVFRALRRAYGNLARANGIFLKPNEFDFEGYTFTEVKGLNANTMVAYDKNQVFFGTGLTSDFNEIKVLDMDEHDLSGTVRMKVVFTGGVQYAYGGEIVLYRA